MAVVAEVAGRMLAADHYEKELIGIATLLAVGLDEDVGGVPRGLVLIWL